MSNRFQTLPLRPKFQNINYIMTSFPHMIPWAFIIETLNPTLYEPIIFKQTQSFPHWHQTISEEYDTSMRNNTWVLMLSSP